MKYSLPDAYAAGRGQRHDEQNAGEGGHPATNLSIETAPYHLERTNFSPTLWSFR